MEVTAGFFCLPGAFSPWNLDFSSTFLDGLGKSWDGGSLVNLIGFRGENLFDFLSLLKVSILVENLSLMSSWSVLLLISIFKVSHPSLNKEEMNLKVIWLNLFKKGISSSLLFIRSLLHSLINLRAVVS